MELEFPRKEDVPLLTNKKSLEFQIIDWFIPETDKSEQYFKRKYFEKEGEYPQNNYSTPEYDIIIYGVTDSGDSITCTVANFRPYFYLKCPKDWLKANRNNVRDLIDQLKKKTVVGKKYDRSTKKYVADNNKKLISWFYQDHFEDVELVKRKDYWGFTNRKDFNFLKISVKSLGLFNILKRWFGEKEQKEEGWKLYGSNLDPFLKYVHEKKIEPCGWIKIPKYEYTPIYEDDADDSVSSNASEDDSPYKKRVKQKKYFRTTYTIEINDPNIIIPLDHKKVAPFLIASFDIECSSSHGDFPVAKKDYRKLATDLIVAAKDDYAYFKNNLKEWLGACFTRDIVINRHVTISRVYPKANTTTPIPEITDKIVNGIIDIIKNIKNVVKNGTGTTGKASDDSDDDSDVDDAEDDVGRGSVSANANADDKVLIDYLSNKCGFPELEGDQVIQIGTTVSRFGSDEILYKHLVALNQTDAIDGIDVEWKTTEKDVLLCWKSFISRLDPDILTGYNIFGFDMKYIWERTEELGCNDQFADSLGRQKGRKSMLEKKELSSSALGENIMYYFDTDGIVHIDMLKVMQRDHKLDSYKLDFVAETFLKDKKDDLKPREIFEKFLGDSADRAVIGKYCIQDCALCNRLMHKLKVIGNNIGMGNVCFVPLSYLFMRGQGIKIFSLVSRECHHNNYVIPVIGSGFESKADLSSGVGGTADAEDGYEGAIVLEPICDMYLEDPITVFDYSSLYPSCMISRNLSHDSYVTDMNSPYANLEGVEYIDIEYDVYEGTGDKKHVTGKKTCRFAQFPNGEKGVLPTILMNLLRNRKVTRKKIEYETLTVTDAETGGTKEVTGCVSEKDDNYIVVDAEVDKVTIVAKDKVTDRRDTYGPFEQAVLDALQLAYKITANSLYGQTGSRFSSIYLKDIAACTTATGREMIYLAKNFMEREYGVEVVYGDSVLGNTPILVRNKITSKITVKTISELGMIDIKTEWYPYTIFKQNDTDEAERKDKEQISCDNYEVWTDYGWSKIRRVIRHKCNKKIYRIINKDGIVDVTEDHSLMTKERLPIKPSQITNDTELLKFFPHKFELSSDYDSYIDMNYDNIPNKVIITKDKLEAQKIYTSLKSKGYIVLLASKNDEIHIAYDNANIELTSKYLEEIQYNDISLLYNTNEYKDYVYDIETEVGVFQAGVGCLILKNTDSIFCKFPLDCPKEQRLEKAIELGIKAEKAIKAEFKKPGYEYQSLAYEKVLFPLILLSKKRYIGNLYEKDPKKFKEKSMGVVTKRRDNAHIVKIVYGGIIQILLNQNNLNAAVDFLKLKLQELIDGKIPLENLIISKTLKSTYKDPTKIAHKVLADRMGDRDIGNKPMVNDRVPYIYIKSPDGNIPKLQGDRIEHPDYIREQNLIPDYYFYITNQLLKPVCQLFALCLTKLPGYCFPVEYWEQIDEELLGKDLYKDDKKRDKRIQNLKLKEVENLLFAEFLRQLEPAKKSRAGAGTSAAGAGTSSRGRTQLAQLKEVEHFLTVKSKEIKRGKEYTVDVILKHKETELWNNTYTMKYTKEKSLAHATEKAFKHIALNFMNEDINKNVIESIIIEVGKTDKKYIDEWKRALKNAKNAKNISQTAIADVDSGTLKELLEERSKYQNLVEIYEYLTYDWKIV